MTNRNCEIGCKIEELVLASRKNKYTTYPHMLNKLGCTGREKNPVLTTEMIRYYGNTSTYKLSLQFCTEEEERKPSDTTLLRASTTATTQNYFCAQIANNIKTTHLNRSVSTVVDYCFSKIPFPTL